LGLVLPALIALLSAAGYFVTSETIRGDRDSDVARRVEVDTVGAQVILGRARSYVVGLGTILAGEPVARQQRFVQLAGGTAGGVGLLDALWVERLPASARRSYEARVGAPITRLTPAGSFEPAPTAPSYLPATFTTNGIPELPSGVDVSHWPGLGAALRVRSSASSVSVSELGSLGGQPGFYFLQRDSFGHGSDSRGYLVVFVPQGWLTSSIGADPRLLAVSVDGGHLEGFDSPSARNASFAMFGRQWRIDVAAAPVTGLQTLLPWLSIAWPLAAALIAVLVGRAIVRRRRAEREVERIFDLSLDMLCIAGLDGYFKRVNPAFARTLGYTTKQLLSRPLLDFVHPDDRAVTAETMETLARGETVVEFENRHVCSDGSVRWLEWSTPTVLDDGLVYAAARDVTDRRRAADELRESQRLVEDSRDELRMLVDEQAALRRMATLVAEAPAPSAVLDAVASEMKALLDADQVALSRYEAGAEIVVLAQRGLDVGRTPVGSRVSHEGENATSIVRRTGRPARIGDYEGTGGAIAEIARATGLGWSVAAPIVVDGRAWGLISASWKSKEPPPEDTEDRMVKFAQLLVTAIANAESREAENRLAGEQEALRRVATLVARGVSATELFWAVSDEVAHLFSTEFAAVGRFEPDGRTLDLVGANRTHERWESADFLASAEVLRTGRAARTDAERWRSDESEAAGRLRSLGIVSTAASPISVDGELWGVMLVAGTEERLPPDTEGRLDKFTGLVATAIANAQAREALRQLVNEQTTLRRIATLVAQGPSSQELFGAVAEEIGRVLPAAVVSIGRYEPDDSVTVMASWSVTGAAFATGGRWPARGTSVAATVRQTGQSAHIDDFSEAVDPLGVALREAGVKSSVGSPIVVEDLLWGVISAASTEGPMPPGAEARLASFTELVATAVANAEGSAELAASRRRIVAASDDARRRIERDLHDGVQQQLVSLGLGLGAIEARLPPGDALNEQLASVSNGVRSVLDALGEIAHGIHPAILSHGGLAPALKGLARRSSVPVELHAHISMRIPDEAEVAAYYIVSEALTNVAKHARANVVLIDVTTEDGTLTLSVRDDGIGGADPREGSGLVGLRDRVEALGGTIAIESPAGDGTCVVVRLPIATEPPGAKAAGSGSGQVGNHVGA
jgi:PAS domain S-box-containing protein